MLEALVAPRIRRTLFEYLLTHPADRFYLRGLAKELQLSISPLRRELKRLERAGMLRAIQEGNILFYTVNTDSPAFLQLRQACLSPSGTDRQAGRLTESPSPSVMTREAVVPASPVAVRQTPVRRGTVVGLAGLSIALMGLLVCLQASRLLRPHTSERTAVSPASASGAMRGGKWQLAPGGMGGFSSASNSGAH